MESEEELKKDLAEVLGRLEKKLSLMSEMEQLLASIYGDEFLTMENSDLIETLLTESGHWKEEK